jgi:hypothetical protein
LTTVLAAAFLGAAAGTILLARELPDFACARFLAGFAAAADPSSTDAWATDEATDASAAAAGAFEGNGVFEGNGFKIASRVDGICSNTQGPQRHLRRTYVIQLIQSSR